MTFDLADWYRSAQIVPTEDTLKRRQKGVDAFIKNVDAQSLIQLGKLAFGIAKPKDIDVSKLMLPFKKTDNAFSFEDGHEIEILAGCVLGQLLAEGKGSETQKVCALIVQICFFQGIRSPIHHKGLPELAALITERTPASLKKLATPNDHPFSFEVCDVAVAKAFERINSENPTSANLPPLVKAIRNEIRQIKEYCDARVAGMEKATFAIQADHEEKVEMLWWLLGEWSVDAGLPLADVPKPAVAIYVGKELANLSHGIRGPSAVPAIIDKALKLAGAVEKTTIQNSINSVNRNWRERFASSESLESAGSVCPISIAISKSLETDGKNDWLPIFLKSSGINARKQMTPITLALQMYHECMLIKRI